MNELMPIEIIENKIYIIRGQKVMLDKDLAWLYEVETKKLNQAVKRNIERFPEDFMFQLTKEEFDKLMSEDVTFKMGNKGLRSQSATSSEDEILMSQFVTSSWGGIRKMPYAFTEHGVAMLSSVLRSERAIAINIQIVRIFNKLRNMAIEHKSLRDELTELKNSFIKYAKGNNLELEEIYKQLDYLHGGCGKIQKMTIFCNFSNPTLEVLTPYRLRDSRRHGVKPDIRDCGKIKIFPQSHDITKPTKIGFTN